MDQAAEISELLGQEMGDGVDEDELEAEGAQLHARRVGEALLVLFDEVQVGLEQPLVA